MRRRHSNIHERFLRHVWSEQYLHTSELKTNDDRAIRVFDVGKLNLDGGPDFICAKIEIGNILYCGDVEIHRTPFEWLQHQHQDDPRYNKVILHVVLDVAGEEPLTTVQSGRSIPVLVLGQFLSQPLPAIWEKAILNERARANERIACSSENGNVGPAILKPWIEKLAVERLELKLRRFEERLKELATEHFLLAREAPRTWGEPDTEGKPDEISPPEMELTSRHFTDKRLWEQLLYEGIMEALGYSKNRPPFIRLSRSLPLSKFRELGISGDQVKIQSCLFGVSGLLPTVSSVRTVETRSYVRKLVRSWKAMRRSIGTELLHPGDWQFFPMRPTNFPTLRLAAASVLVLRLMNEDIFRSIIQAIKSQGLSETKRAKLHGFLAIPPIEFWNRHYHFNRVSRSSVTPLGRSRIDEMIVNTIYPLALLYARVFKDGAVRRNVIELYQSGSPGQDNSITRLIKTQLLKGKIELSSASLQQGSIQLYNYYCREVRCLECEVGKIVFRK